MLLAAFSQRLLAGGKLVSAGVGAAAWQRLVPALNLVAVEGSSAAGQQAGAAGWSASSSNSRLGRNFCSQSSAMAQEEFGDRDVCIVSVARTPLGSLGGSLSTLSATRLGSLAIQAAVRRAGISPTQVQEVFMGNVLSCGLGQAPARQAALKAGLPQTTPCTTLNKVCASGLKSITMGAQSIMLGLNDIVVAGGMESMSNAPYYLSKARQGFRMGHGEVTDSMIHDGLWDAYGDCHMGTYAELCAEEYQITREMQDEHAIRSYERAAAAHQSGEFRREVVPVDIPGMRGQPPSTVEDDDEYKKADFAKLRKLRPAFSADGTVTAGNASSISDGAAAVVLASGAAVREHSLSVLAVIRGFADAEQAPERFTTSPSFAIPRALSRAGIEANEVDYYEVNEAFSVVDLANQKLLGLDPERVNVNGGAVALGHPIGCSGARIVVTLTSILLSRKARYGAAGVCNGGGGATAIVIENFNR
eukprot:jgi/Chlat1/9170/Chrsp97S08453